MAERGIYSKEVQEMIDDFKVRAAEITGWVGETPAPEFAYPAHRVASKELISHMASAADFRNPLYKDESYARNTRWGGIIAPPFFYHTILHGGRNCFPHLDPKGGIIRSERVLMIQKADFYQQIRPDDTFRIWQGPTTIDDVTESGEDSQHRFKLTRIVSYINQRDEVVCSNTDTHFYLVYPPSKDTGSSMHFVVDSKNDDNTPMLFTEEYHYTKEDIATIDNLYNSEELRGNKILYWEDVEVGDELPPVVQGPYTTWDAVVSMQGFGAASLTMNDLRNLNADTLITDPNTNIPHQDIELHLMSNVAKLVNSYSTTLLGPPILHFFTRLVTNWGGDDAFLRRLTWTKLANTPIGDTIFGRGRVVRKYIENGEHLVDIDIWMESVRGFISNVGPATVSLLSRANVFNKNTPPKFKAAVLSGNYESDTGCHTAPTDIKAGDRVRIKARPDWPMPAGYPLENHAGTVYQIIGDPVGYALVEMDNDASGIDARIPLGFRTDAIEKI